MISISWDVAPSALTLFATWVPERAGRTSRPASSRTGRLWTRRTWVSMSVPPPVGDWAAAGSRTSDVLVSSIGTTTAYSTPRTAPARPVTTRTGHRCLNRAMLERASSARSAIRRPGSYRHHPVRASSCLAYRCHSVPASQQPRSVSVARAARAPPPVAPGAPRPTRPGSAHARTPGPTDPGDRARV